MDYDCFIYQMAKCIEWQNVPNITHYEKVDYGNDSSKYTTPVGAGGWSEY